MSKLGKRIAQEPITNSGAAKKKLKPLSENGNLKSKTPAADKETGKLTKPANTNQHDYNLPNEKTDWTKFKQEKKELKLKRKKLKDIYEITVEAKQIYEKLKCRRTQDKPKLVEQLHKLFSDSDAYKKLVMAHDTGRILQCMLKYAASDVRNELSEKLLEHVVEMCKSKYSHFCVLRMLKYSAKDPDINSKLINCLYGQIVKLCCHKISSSIIDHIYIHIASNEQKNFMRQEFYSRLYRQSKDSDVKNIAGAYKDNATMKASVLSAVKANINTVANKGLVDNSLIHAVMLEYLLACGEEDMKEIIQAFATLVPSMLSTKEGARAATICFYNADTRNRRIILVQIKPHLVKIATHEHGHLFLISVINSLDDTKATKKVIYDRLHDELQTIVANQYGRRVIYWLITPANTKCFNPALIETINEGLKYGKKDKDVRRKEIFDQIENPITKAIVAEPEYWLSNKHIGLLTADILKNLSGAFYNEAAVALAGVIVQPNWMISDDTASTRKKKKVSADIETLIELQIKQRKANKLQELKGQLAVNSVEGEDDHQSDDDDDSSSSDSDASDHDTEVKKEAEKSIEEAADSNERLIEGIVSAGMHFVLKKIIRDDEQRKQCDKTFGYILLHQLTTDALKHWLTINRACFILVTIVERSGEHAKEKLQKILKDNCIELDGSTGGGQLLIEKLNC